MSLVLVLGFLGVGLLAWFSYVVVVLGLVVFGYGFIGDLVVAFLVGCGGGLGRVLLSKVEEGTEGVFSVRFDGEGLRGRGGRGKKVMAFVE